jgi:hypothetical protein
MMIMLMLTAGSFRFSYFVQNLLNWSKRKDRVNECLLRTKTIDGINSFNNALIVKGFDRI